MKKLKTMLFPGIITFGLVALLSLTGCKTVEVPEGVEVVTDFDIKAYSGQWYEIARFDFKHEKDLNQVTANYTLNEDGSVTVENKGYNYVKKDWEVAKGKAKFIGETNKGALKVSFFGPFYSGYNVVLMDPDYQNALVFGENTDYVWILSRSKTIPDSVKTKFVEHAKKAGYDTSRFVWTQQE